MESLTKRLGFDAPLLSAAAAAPIPILLGATLLCLVLFACDGGVGINLLQPGRTWVAIDPVQCLTNPWEMDWLAHHDDAYGAYPRDLDSQYVIIRAYYDTLGVDITDILSIHRYDAVCEACNCPRGDVLYMNVRDGDVGTMLSLGYRVEFPIKPPDDQETTWLGLYHYTGYDSFRTVLFTGTLKFTRVDTANVWGTWRLDGPTGYGPQIGVGSFEGWVDGDVVTLNLNPGWADNNVFLYGEMKDGVYAGQWQWVTFIGPTYTGHFTAVKE